MLACVIALSGCSGRETDSDLRPAFSDVVRELPKAQNPATPEYLVTEERPLAEWIAEIGAACEQYGCRK
jgi:hypothetical protein